MFKNKAVEWKLCARAHQAFPVVLQTGINPDQELLTGTGETQHASVVLDRLEAPGGETMKTALLQGGWEVAHQQVDLAVSTKLHRG